VYKIIDQTKQVRIKTLLYDMIYENILAPQTTTPKFYWNEKNIESFMNSIINDVAIEPILFLQTVIPAQNCDKIDMKRKKKKVILEPEGLCQLTTLFMLYVGEIPSFLSINDLKTDPRNLHYNLNNGNFKYYNAFPGDKTILNVQKYFYSDMPEGWSTFIKNTSQEKMTIYAEHHPKLYRMENKKLSVQIIDKPEAQKQRLTIDLSNF